MSTVVLYCWCRSNSASVLLYFTFNEKDIIAVRNAIDEDARYTVEEISDITNINSSAVFSILKECLKLRKVCARWVPHLLTENQKRN